MSIQYFNNVDLNRVDFLSSQKLRYQGQCKGVAEGTNAPSILKNCTIKAKFWEVARNIATTALVSKYIAPSIFNPCAVPGDTRTPYF